MKIWKRMVSLILAGAVCAALGMAGAGGFGTVEAGAPKAAGAVQNVKGVFGETAMAAEYSGGTKYFRDQLEGQAKKFYDAMLQMYSDGTFRSSGDLDLLAGGYVNRSQLEQYAGGDQTLLEEMAAARDAFQYDYPDAFYVDFSALSLRVTRDSKGAMHGYLGNGRRSDYYMPGFQNSGDVDRAISAYNTKISEIASQAAQKAGDDIKEQIYSVHDYLTQHMIYRYEHQVTAGNARTAYDAVICGEGVCEAYARGFKAILDRMDIPCICVYGLYQTKDMTNEEHIWNYVQVEGSWYGVDVTHDDPTNRAWTEKFSKHETREYCLVGQMELAGHHFPSGILSASNYEFTYPQLELEALRGEYFLENGDLKVKLVEENITDDGESITGGSYCVSYRGKNYTQNAEDGYYLLVKYYMYTPSTDTWQVSDWSYMDPWPVVRDDQKAAEKLEPLEPMEELGNYIKLPMPQVKKAQFAVTTIAPGYSKDMNEKELIEALNRNGAYYQGNPLLLTIMTKEIDNPWGDYIALPYLEKTTPSMTGALTTGNTYHMVFRFDQKLVKKEDESLDVVIQDTETLNADKGAGSAVKYSKISDVAFDGDRTVTFDFTPSAQFADDTTFYSLQVTGLIGEDSQKAPIPATYMACAPCRVYAYKAQGFDWNVFGQPQLLETTDLSTDGWSAEDIDTGEASDIEISDKITHRLTLVTTEASKKQEKEMQDILGQSEAYGDETFLKTQMYNIKLTLCKSQIIKTGQGVRVSVGFPAGFDYDSSLDGVTFKAYHYIVDPKTNEITGVEEIPVTITPYGLVVTVRSFSPFAIAAVESEETDTAKAVVVSGNVNGRILDASGNALTGAAGILKLASAGDNCTLRVQADDGYEIEEIRLNDRIINVSGRDAMDISLDYDSLDRSTIVGASFVSVDAYQGETPSTNSGDAWSGQSGNKTTKESGAVSGDDAGSGNGNTADTQNTGGNAQSTDPGVSGQVSRNVNAGTAASSEKKKTGSARTSKTPEAGEQSVIAGKIEGPGVSGTDESRSAMSQDPEKSAAQTGEDKKTAQAANADISVKSGAGLEKILELKDHSRAKRTAAAVAGAAAVIAAAAVYCWKKKLF